MQPFRWLLDHEHASVVAGLGQASDVSHSLSWLDRVLWLIIGSYRAR
jgi:hypothetical protein